MAMIKAVNFFVAKNRKICGPTAKFAVVIIAMHTHTHPFNGHFSGTTQVSRYQKGKTNLDFSEARDSKWQWHQLEHMQVCTSPQTDNHASTSPHKFFYRPDALPAAQPTASKALKALIIAMQKSQIHRSNAGLN